MSSDLADTIRKPLALMVDVLNDDACRDALVALDALAARCDTLEKERDDAINGRDDLPMAHVVLAKLKAAEARCDALENANAQLRDALDWIEAEPEDPAKVQARARDALAATDTTPKIGPAVRRLAHDEPARGGGTQGGAGVPPPGERQEA